ncbi:benzoate 4-monooxygenase cytochrome P450 [Aspergillus similis]
MPSVYLFLYCAIALVLMLLRRVAVYFWDSKGLRKYPGLDALSGFTNLSFIFQARQAPEFRTKMLFEAHRSHSVIRLGPNYLSFSNIEAIKDIYGHSTPCIKGDMYSTPGGAHRNVLDSVDKMEHSQKRRRLAVAFSAKHLEGWEFKVVDKCTRLISQFDKYAASFSSPRTSPVPVDFRLWTNLFTVEAIAEIALSQKLGLLEAGHDIVECEDVNGNISLVSFFASIKGVGRSQVPVIWSHHGYGFLKKVASFLSSDFAKEVANETAFGGIVRRLVSKRLEQRRLGDPLDDLCTSLKEHREGDKKILHRAEIEAECNAFMNAGSDTTAIQLTHVLYYLLKNPSKMQKLRDELDAHISPDVVVPPYAVVRTLPYLKACLDESLRLSPPVSSGLQRKTPPEGMYIKNEWIPGNTLVSLPAYIAHRDETAFPNPEEFLPERWLSEKAKEVQKYFIPFSAGSRGCIGRNITYLEQHVLIAALVRRFDFAFADPNWEMEWEEQYNLWPGTMPVIIKHRSLC